MEKEIGDKGDREKGRRQGGGAKYFLQIEGGERRVT